MGIRTLAVSLAANVSVSCGAPRFFVLLLLCRLFPCLDLFPSGLFPFVLVTDIGADLVLSLLVKDPIGKTPEGSKSCIGSCLYRACFL